MKKILIIDDSAQILLMYKMVLMSYRCHFVEALNGQEGLYQLKKNPDTDLILLDINMPLMSGIDFMKAVSAKEEFRPIPVIIVSTAGRELETAQGIALGARGFVTKPFKPKELLALINGIAPSSTGSLQFRDASG